MGAIRKAVGGLHDLGSPEMFAHLGLALGKCGQPYSGGVEFNMVGGKAPYRIQLKAKEANAWQEQWTEQDATTRRKLHLSSGTYQYLVTDAQTDSTNKNFTSRTGICRCLNLMRNICWASLWYCLRRRICLKEITVTNGI